MSDAATSTDATAPAKTHYAVLDGLRGVAAMMVVLFHLFEAYAQGDPQNQIVNHGYLAVDFFFLLSGFVVAYAYDDRWGRMSRHDFYKRRLIRLQPMIVFGSVLGAVLFWFQDYSIYPLIGDASPWAVVAVMLVGMTLVPLPPSADVRGWSESYPLNGPAWSLFYEYIANILYAVVLRRLPLVWLALLVMAAALLLVLLAVAGPRGDLIGGWSLDADGMRIGFSRVLFPFLAGVLLMRSGLRIRSRHAFAWCGLAVIVALALPRFGGTDRLWLNGLYEAACVIVLFPLIVAVGAGETRADGRSIRVARFFGAISYPLYITHYPLIYIYTGWVVDVSIPPAQGAVAGAGVLAAAVLISYGSLKLYDEPIRRRLAARFLARPRRTAN